MHTPCCVLSCLKNAKSPLAKKRSHYYYSMAFTHSPPTFPASRESLLLLLIDLDQLLEAGRAVQILHQIEEARLLAVENNLRVHGPRF